MQISTGLFRKAHGIGLIFKMIDFNIANTPPPPPEKKAETYFFM